MSTSTRYRPPQTRGWHATHDELARSFAAWGVRDWSAQPNVMLSRANSPSLSKVERAVTLAMDRYETASANLKVLALCIDDMRMIERRGLAETMQSAYLQLAAPASERDPYEVMGLRPGASAALVESAYKTLAKAVHPDAGGSDAEMAALNAARERLLEQLAVNV